MLFTTIFGLNKPQSTDASSALRTAIGANADLLEALLDRRGYAEVLTDQTNGTGGGPVDLATVGPSVTVSVPANGLVAIRAQVTILGTVTTGGRVYVREDAGTPWLILGAPGAESVPRATFPGSIDGTNTLQVAGWHVFPAAAGSHTYKLMYASNGVTNANEHFKDRKLWVRALAF